MKSNNLPLAGAAVIVLLMLAVAYGWIVNLIALVGMDWDVGIGIEGILRIVGIVVVPIGAVMGIFV